MAVLYPARFPCFPGSPCHQNFTSLGGQGFDRLSSTTLGRIGFAPLSLSLVSVLSACLSEPNPPAADVERLLSHFFPVLSLVLPPVVSGIACPRILLPSIAFTSCCLRGV